MKGMFLKLMICMLSVFTSVKGLCASITTVNLSILPSHSFGVKNHIELQNNLTYQ